MTHREFQGDRARRLDLQVVAGEAVRLEVRAQRVLELSRTPARRRSRSTVTDMVRQLPVHRNVAAARCTSAWVSATAA